ncbi:MAG: efflux RND transporter periplasmic adaptor subunit, partial [Desulfobulbaceae bacterium]|nr:efflux RND transporter periplasmic adaptor subunit [Desulfobulbaceae bacterium]
MKLFWPSKLIICSLYIAMIALPPASFAKPETDRFFTAELAAHSNTLTGFTRPRASIKLTSQLTDRLTEVKAEVGDRIGKDGIFARLDTTYARIDLEKIRINQTKLVSKISYLEKEVQRFQTLFQKQSAAEAKLDSLRQDLAQARLALRSVENEERALQEHLQRHTITAPPGWLVINRDAEPGEWVIAGNPLAEVGDFQTLLVPFAVSQDEYLWIKQRAKDLRLRLPERNLTVKAQLHTVSPGFDQQSRKLNLEIKITSDLPEKRGGIRAELTTELPDPAGALLVPVTAVSNRYDSHWLTRTNGQKVPVIVLGRGLPPDTLRVSAAAIKA